MRTLVIGASRGIGAELARRTIASGHVVDATARSGDAPSGARTVHCDVTDQASVARAAVEVEGPIGLLIQNAGINPPSGQSFGSADPAAWAHMFDVNVLGPLRVAEAFRSHLREGSVAAFVSSQLGSMSLGGGVGYPAYNASKAALNKMCQDLAAAWKPAGITVLALHPGWVRTDMGGPNASISADESARGILDVVTSKGIADTGTFWNWNGTPHAW